jgi:hypothetical protein
MPSSQARLSQRHKVVGVGRVSGLGQRVRMSWRVSGAPAAASRVGSVSRAGATSSRILLQKLP